MEARQGISALVEGHTSVAACYGAVVESASHASGEAMPGLMWEIFTLLE
ncbi:MAG: hypothetical protein P4L87_00900 [Formivibrio sp.]|nr:hypothetical protein [Formivibrio sp.]